MADLREFRRAPRVRWIAAGRWILERTLPPDEAEAVLGDLLEESQQSRRPVRVFLAACAIAAHRAIRRRSASAPSVRRRTGSMITLATDLRQAVRSQAKRPGFSITIVATLALTVGATSAMFAVVDAVLFRALPFADADRLVWLGSVRPDNPDGPFTLPEFMDYRDQTRSLTGMAAYANWSASLAGEGPTERFQGARMSANVFDVLGISASAGRLLQASDDRADAARVVVISHRLWQDRFGGARDVVGRSVRINGEAFVIVGVLPSEFPLPLRDIEIVTPLVPDRDPLRHARASVNFLRLIGRLNRDVTAEQARQELTAICAALRGRFPTEYARKDAVSVTSLSDAIIGDHRPGVVLLFTSVLVVLAAALANLLCLVLVRSNDRRPEMSIRTAMGASRLRLGLQLAAEALVLAAAGGALGGMIAAVAIATAPALAPAIPRLAEVRFDARALLCVAGLTIVATTLIALAAIGTLLRTRAHAMRPSGRVTADRWNRRVRDLLVVGEISSAVVLLVATTLLVQNLLRLQRVDLGFDQDPVFQARVSLPPAYRSPADLSRFYDRLAERIAALPGVRHVGLVSAAPMSGVLTTVPFTVAGQPPPTRRDVPAANLRAITPGYLEAAGTRLIRGRSFSDTDRESAPPVALVSAALGDRLIAGDPLGRRLLIDDNNTGPRPVEIVGIVENVRQMTISGPASLDVYIPLFQIHPDNVGLLRNNQFWMVRAETDPAAFARSFSSELQAVDRDAAISGTGTMRRPVDAWFAPLRFSLGLFAMFSLTAVLLSVSGLYALIAYTVSQRRREIGLRMALGATAGDVRRLFLRHAVLLACSGIAVGLILAAIGRPLSARLASNPSLDPRAASGIAVLLLAVVLLAAWLPARRAARVAPTVALKTD